MSKVKRQAPPSQETAEKRCEDNLKRERNKVADENLDENKRQRERELFELQDQQRAKED